MKKIIIASLILAASLYSANGKALFGKCAGCHGMDAGKKALGKSAIIKGWSASKVEKALNGYKDGSYGKTMKALMKGQVATLSKSDIKALAKHISSL
jgi:cytochrome c553